MAHGIDPVAATKQALGVSRSEIAPELARFRRAANEFESLFLNHLLKSMRSSSSILQDSEESDSGGDLMRELMDEQLARSLAHHGGLGLARMLEKQYAPKLESSMQAENAASAEDRSPASQEPGIVNDTDRPGDNAWNP